MTPQHTIPTGQLLAAHQWRYATKKFDAARKVPTEDMKALEASLVLTPSSFGLQPWKFIIVSDQAIKDELVAHSWGQQQVADCSHLVVFTARTSMSEQDVQTLIDRTVEVRALDATALDGYKDMMLGFIAKQDAATQASWTTHQSYIALAQLMQSAALLGIDTCPMEGILPAEYDRILGLEGTGYRTTLACPVGYRAEDDAYAALAKVRFDHAQLIEHR